ncbi:hypothetical protein GPALN_010774 [Globodera pallida]|nr:hypothetical protein GPALN_010774 [Globodera pallida]
MRRPRKRMPRSIVALFKKELEQALQGKETKVDGPQKNCSAARPPAMRMTWQLLTQLLSSYNLNINLAGAELKALGEGTPNSGAIEQNEMENRKSRIRSEKAVPQKRGTREEGGLGVEMAVEAVQADDAQPSKKPFEAAEGPNAIVSPKMCRLVIPRRPSKDVHFVAHNETPPPELPNSNLTRPRFSPKENQMEASNENSRLIFFFGAEEQFVESLEEKMARRIGNNWKCYSKRGSGDRRKAKWLRLLEAFEHRWKKKSEALKSLHL